MTHLPCQYFLAPLKRNQQSIDKIDLPSSEGPTYNDEKHGRTRLCLRRLNGIEIMAQFRQEVSIMRFKKELLHHGRRVGEAGKNRNMSRQRGNKFNSSYRDMSVIVAENNSVVKPKYQQYSSLNKMLSNFSKVLMAHISFTAVINNGGIGKGIGGIRIGTKKNISNSFPSEWNI